MPLPMAKGDGFTVRWKYANSQPETAASTAAITNTVSLSRKVEMPIASAMVEPLLSARMARPGRESSRCVAASAASSANSPDQHVQAAAGAQLDAEAPAASGMPRMPSYLPSHSMLAMV